MNFLRAPRWSPYAVGAGIGVLSWVTFAAMGKSLGVSTTFVRAAGALEGIAGHVEDAPYFVKYLGSGAEPLPVFEWQFALVVFLALGAYLAARLSGERVRECVPELWARRFGPSPVRRYIWAFAGGVILLFGARLAGGCTSGHGISGGLQLAVSSWVFLAGMFGGGILAARLIYGGKGGGHV